MCVRVHVHVHTRKKMESLIRSFLRPTCDTRSLHQNGGKEKTSKVHVTYGCEGFGTSNFVKGGTFSSQRVRGDHEPTLLLKSENKEPEGWTVR